MKKNHRNLTGFINELEKENELIRFNKPVSNILEITEIHRPHVKTPRRRQGLTI